MSESVALVTGAGIGLGRATALALADANADELDALSTQIDSINPGSGWAQRILLMRSTLDVDSSETGSEGEIAFETP